jgi:hypothetical protein
LLFWSIDLGESLRRTLLLPFLPHALRDRVDAQIGAFVTSIAAGASTPVAPSLSTSQAVSTPIGVPRVVDGRLIIGDVSYPVVAKPLHPELVPQILFYDIPKHVQILQDMLKVIIVVVICLLV